jgi:hypothetical protein
MAHSSGEGPQFADELTTLVGGQRELGEILREAYIAATPGDHIRYHVPWRELPPERRRRYNTAATAVAHAAIDRDRARWTR